MLVSERSTIVDGLETQNMWEKIVRDVKTRVRNGSKVSIVETGWLI